ncbi:MAG: hypothetical protein ACYSR7_01790 [Planctomycetota bacterium]|jgi:hypothetical protein
MDKESEEITDWQIKKALDALGEESVELRERFKRYINKHFPREPEHTNNCMGKEKMMEKETNEEYEARWESMCGVKERTFRELMIKTCYSRTLREAAKVLEMLAPIKEDEENWILHRHNIDPIDQERLREAIATTNELFWDGIEKMSNLASMRK